MSVGADTVQQHVMTFQPPHSFPSPLVYSTGLCPSCTGRSGSPSSPIKNSASRALTHRSGMRLLTFVSTLTLFSKHTDSVLTRGKHLKKFLRH